ncbi:MAG: hypothetical protein KDD66_03420 [Bdellovibrionales bacterium]|nr:hypothetical protein [Bdellovibrionales bacterium]
MANTSVFQSIRGVFAPHPTALNSEFAPAYEFSAEHKLAQYIVTGTINDTFYANAETQLDQILSLCGQVSPAYVAKAAIYARKHAYMKDAPALLVAALTVLDSELFKTTFHQVIDNGKMLRNFVQIMRSGVVARKSLGSSPKMRILEWLESKSDKELFHMSVGNNPSIADIIKMVHPKPSTASRAALYGYLLGRAYDAQALPEIVKEYEAFKHGATRQVPDVPFQMLTSLELDNKAWTTIAQNASWQMARMNLNTFARHGVFNQRAVARGIAKLLKDPTAIKRARVFPYQLLAAYYSTGADVPHCINDALQDALEIALENVPRVDGKVVVCPDVSGSMSSPVTGYRRGSTTSVRCVDVAALVAAAMLRTSREAVVLPFEHSVVDVRLNQRDSVMTNAAKLAAIGGGGTNCSAPLAWLNKKKVKANLVVYVSDNESWVDAGNSRRSTGMMSEWNAFKQRNPRAKLVCIDIQPYGTTQASDRKDILNIGGFSDQVFKVISDFARDRMDASHWTTEIERIVL